MLVKIGQLLIDKEVRDNPTWSDYESPLAIVTAKGVSNDGVPYWTLVYTANGYRYTVTYDMLLDCYELLP